MKVIIRLNLLNHQFYFFFYFFLASKQIYKEPLNERTLREMNRIEFYDSLGRIADYRVMLAKGKTMEMAAAAREEEMAAKKAAKAAKKKKIHKPKNNPIPT